MYVFVDSELQLHFYVIEIKSWYLLLFRGKIYNSVKNNYNGNIYANNAFVLKGRERERDICIN